MLLIAFISFILFIAIPLPKTERPLSTVIESSEGDLLGAKIATDGQWRFPGLDHIPTKLNVCIRLFEDEYFYYHPGINPISVIRAIQQNSKANKIVSGGSTITMQLARISCGNQPRTYVQKFVELFYSLKFEFRYSKTEILKKYLDNAPFGGNVVGIEAASWRYFERSPFQLSWAETATLAVLPNAPSLIYPGKGQQLLLKKRNSLLQKLFERNILNEMEYELALLEPLPSKPHPLP
ncbi:MAG: transglycosylase domain-containing protein, partial [Bacteroidales bacterium]|nr:transglycosylase domain-containing protein [Bacteroidales bacterium]